MDYFDCHADTLTEIPLSENLWENSCCLDLKRVREFTGSYAQVFAVWIDQAAVLGKPTEEIFMRAYRRAVRLLQEQEEHLAWCKNAADMQKAHAAGKAAAFLSVEDIAAMGSLAGQARELGFCFATLTWNYENAYACGAVTDQSKGLTEEGRALAKRLLGQRIVIDISHLSDQGCEDIFRLTDRPVMASHSNVRDVCGHPRNLKKEHIQELIQRKGLLGLNFYSQFVGRQPKAADLLRHADEVLNLGGEDILAIGSDFDGCWDQFPEGIAGIQSVPYLESLFEREGFGSGIVRKIFFGNARRFLEEMAG